jgi:uncharacterized protein (TIGR01777 family)
VRILISGASGLVGSATAGALRADGHDIARLVRHGGNHSLGDVRWDPESGAIDTDVIEGTDAVVHLAGAGIGDRRWSEGRKKILLDSRVNSTRTLVDALAQLQRKPRVLVAASAVGYYGDRGDEPLTESSSSGTGFLATLARDWETQSLRAESLGMRVVLLRFGMILDARGGALPRMIRPFKLGLGGRLGSGRQWISWIGLEDVVRVIFSALVDEKLSGPVNVVAPNPVRNVEFTIALARVLHRPAIFPVPAFVLRLALGEMADELLLASQCAVPHKLVAQGHAFRFPELDATLHSLLCQM